MPGSSRTSRATRWALATLAPALLGVAAVVVPAAPAAAAGDLFVAPNGSDAAAGTLAAPLRACNGRSTSPPRAPPSGCAPAGTLATNVRIMKDGTAAQPYTVAPYRGEKVVLDGESLPHTAAPGRRQHLHLERGVLHMETSVAPGRWPVRTRRC